MNRGEERQKDKKPFEIIAQRKSGLDGGCNDAERECAAFGRCARAVRVTGAVATREKKRKTILKNFFSSLKLYAMEFRQRESA